MDDLISRKAVAEHMKVWAGCDKCDHYNYVRCRACSWDDAMACVDAEESVPAVPMDKLCEWLGERYEPPFSLIEIEKLKWPIDFRQQKEIWMLALTQLMEETKE